ncbi:hypothetical protein Tco_1279968 [Tanacetum coccineum]
MKSHAPGCHYTLIFWGCDNPTGQNLVSCKCLFKINEGIEGAQNPRRYMMIACKRKAEIGSTKHLQKKEFDMKKLKEAKNILGMEIIRDQSRKIMRVSQSGYIFKLNVLDGVLEGMHSLCGTANVGLVYGTDCCNNVDVTYFVDSEYAKDPDKSRSITCYTFVIYGCVVSCKATLQHAVTLSTKEVEYMAFLEVVKEAIWVRGLLEELGVELNTVTKNCDF